MNTINDIKTSNISEKANELIKNINLNTLSEKKAEKTVFKSKVESISPSSIKEDLFPLSELKEYLKNK